MKYADDYTNKKAKLAIISYKSLSRLCHTLIPDYATRADIRTIDKVFDDAVETARALIKAGQVDVFVSAGANSAYLRNQVPIPVVQIKVSGFDLMRALLKARQISEKIALVTYQETNSDLDEVKQLLNLNIEQRSYRTIEDAKDKFRELAANGYHVIVGASLIVDLAEQAGLTGIFIYSPNSVRQAIEDAIEITRITRIEEARRQRLNTILHHLNEGVVAVDLEERIQAFNPAMEALTGIPREKALGMCLNDIAPQLSLERTLDRGLTELQQIQQIGRKTIVTNRIPITEDGVRSGAVLTVQDATSIKRADRNIRSRNRSRNFFAKYQLSQVIGRSKSIEHARLLATQYAKTDSTILITGASGTGKELFAQGIHSASRRRNHPFVAINCAALPESLLESELFGYEEGAFTGSRRGGKTGLIESAHTGTIFLDEIGDMPIALQTRFLRVLQEKEVLRLGSTEPIPVDVRVIAATNCHLKEKIADGKFREDLYYRLNLLHLYLPRLCERRQDIPAIAQHLLSKALRKLGSNKPLDPMLDSIVPHFMKYNWPGNVREMENIVERLAVYYSDIEIFDINNHTHFVDIVPEFFSDHQVADGAFSTGDRLKNHSQHYESAYIENVITECDGNRSLAAQRLGISRTTLWRKLRADFQKITP